MQQKESIPKVYKDLSGQLKPDLPERNAGHFERALTNKKTIAIISAKHTQNAQVVKCVGETINVPLSRRRGKTREAPWSVKDAMMDLWYNASHSHRLRVYRNVHGLPAIPNKNNAASSTRDQRRPMRQRTAV